MTAHSCHEVEQRGLTKGSQPHIVGSQARGSLNEALPRVFFAPRCFPDVTRERARQSGLHPYRMVPRQSHQRSRPLVVDSTPARLGQASTGDATGCACNGALGYCRAANRFTPDEPMLRACRILREIQSRSTHTIGVTRLRDRESFTDIQ